MLLTHARKQHRGQGDSVPRCLLTSCAVKWMIPQLPSHWASSSSQPLHTGHYTQYFLLTCVKCVKGAGRGWWDPRLSVATQGLLRPSSPSTPYSQPGDWLCCPRVSYRSEAQGSKGQRRGRIWERTPSERYGRVSPSNLHPPLTATDTTSPSLRGIFTQILSTSPSLLKCLKRPTHLMPQM